MAKTQEKYNGVYISTATVMYYAFVAPVYDFRSLEDLQVVDEADDVWMVYVYDIDTRSFDPEEYFDTQDEASLYAAERHAEVLSVMQGELGMRLSKESETRRKQYVTGELAKMGMDEEGYHPWEDREEDAA
jgi:hypothetical protein